MVDSDHINFKRTFTFLLFFGLWQLSYGQLKRGMVDLSKVPARSNHYIQEYAFDSPTAPTIWANTKGGLNVSFATTDELFLRSEVPSMSQRLQNWEDTGWRRERLNTQVLIWAPDTLEQIRLSVSDLTDGLGHSIGKDNFTIHLVRYVLSNYPYGATNASCDVGASDSAYLMPDRFERFDRFDLPGRTVRSIWVSLDIPAETPAGVYQGSVQINSAKQQSRLSIKIKVQSLDLPPPHDWKFRLDLWQNPWVVSSYYGVKPWSPEHEALLKKHMKPYADAGGTYITTYAVHSPWSDNSYNLEGGMIGWTKATDGSWKFDYTIFDQYVSLCMGMGIDRAITIYTPVPWGFRFRYMDEATGNYKYESWAPVSPEFRAVWKKFLDDLQIHLKEKGWFEKTYLGINENPLEVTLTAARFIKEHSKDWKITYAGDWHPELTDVVDDYSPVISSEPSQRELEHRRKKSLTTTYYVCCTPPKPNNFVFSLPAEGRFISWYASAYGYDGFLRWAYDAWPEDPLRDARHTAWPAGDCFMIYPGGMSSIRFEKLREGIVDFEKIRLLKEMAAKSSDKKIKNSIKALEQHLTLFIDKPEYSKRDYNPKKITRLVNEGKKILEILSDDLAH